MEGKNRLNQEYLRFILLAHLLHQSNEKLKHTNVYKHNLKKNLNRSLKYIAPLAREWKSRNVYDERTYSEIERATQMLIEAISYMDYEEMINANYIVRQYLLDKHNLVFRIPLGKYRKQYRRIVTKLLEYVLTPYYKMKFKFKKK